MKKHISLVIAFAVLFSAYSTIAQQPVDSATIVLYASKGTRTGNGFTVISDSSAAGQQALNNPNAGVPKIVTAAANPSSYVEYTFTADAGRPYHIWIRGRALNNHYQNDSIFMQFAGSVDNVGVAKWRIGTTDATPLSLQVGNGAPISGWMWEDNGYGTIGQDVYFATTGQQRLRLQAREDGIVIDQIMLSPTTFFTARPGEQINDNTIYTENTGAGTPPPPPPPPPTVALCGTDPTAGNLRLAWDAATGATAYQVHFGTGAGNYGTTVDVGTAQTWPIPRRPDWYLVVTAKNSAGTSPRSNEVSTASLP